MLPPDQDKLADPRNMDFRKVQRVNYAFFQIDVAGNIFGTDPWGDPNLLFGPYVWNGGGVEKCSWDGPGVVTCARHEAGRGLVDVAHAQGAEVYPSIGGWTLSDPFPAMSANPKSRSAFAQNCARLVEHYDFDGSEFFSFWLF